MIDLMELMGRSLLELLARENIPLKGGDIIYDSLGRIIIVGGQKIDSYTLFGTPASVGGKWIVYGWFGMPVGIEEERKWETWDFLRYHK